MITRIVVTLITCTFLVLLSFTELDLTQRLLLGGFVVFGGLDSWLEWRRKA